MADRAFLVDDYGNKTLVMAKDLGEDDRGKCYYCAGFSTFGRYKGKKCQVPLTLAISQEHRNYFTVAKNYDHIKGCKFSEKAKDKLVQHLDQSCREKRDVDILNHLFGGKSRPRRDIGNVPIHSPGKNVPVGEGEDDEEALNIRREGRMPQNADELYTLLTELEPDDFFAGKTIADWILDDRTFSRYSKTGLMENQIMLVLMGKMRTEKLPDDLKQFSSKYLVFPTESGDKDEKLYFLIPQEYEFRRAVLGNSAKVFAVLESWHRMDTQVQAYFCSNAPHLKQLTFLPSKFN